MKRYTFSFIAIISAFLFTSCESGLQGTESENEPPTTNMTVNEINRSGENRLPSQIDISWWGDDPDGYITGYEYAINSTDEWHYTERTDSVFILPIPQGDETADVSFYVRAIDNEGARDPEPASLEYPIVNTAPEIEITDNLLPPDTTFNVASFGWTASDPDGDLNLDRVEVQLNDGDWISMPEGSSQITLLINDSNGISPATADVLLGENLVESDITFENVSLNADNKLRFRSVDRAGATSAIESTTWYVKQRSSRILVVNDVQSVDGAYDVRNFHIDKLAETGLTNVDVWDMNDGVVAAGQRVPLSNKFYPVEQLGTVGALAMSQWDYVYWVSTDFNRNLYYAPQMLSEFLAQEGKIFIQSQARQIDERHPLFGFLPIDGLTPNQSSRGFLINSDSEVTPVEGSTYPILTIDDNIIGVNPIVVSAGAIGLYEADFYNRERRGISDHTGNEMVAAMSSERNIIYFSLNLPNLDVDETVDDMLEELTIQELGFQAQ